MIDFRTFFYELLSLIRTKPLEKILKINKRTPMFIPESRVGLPLVPSSLNSNETQTTGTNLPLPLISVHFCLHYIKCFQKNWKIKSNQIEKEIDGSTDYGHTMAKSLILCSPNSNPNPKLIFEIWI